jgi:hypothetical protein
MSDTNLDNYVNLIDLTNLAKNYGKPGGFAEGDTDFNGVIDILDLVNMANVYGQYSGPVHFDTGSTVPEPATLSLLGLMGLAALRRRR